VAPDQVIFEINGIFTASADRHAVIRLEKRTARSRPAKAKEEGSNQEEKTDFHD
jgi:hypothetical protein